MGEVRRDKAIRLKWRNWHRLHHSVGHRPHCVEFSRWENHIEIAIGVDAKAPLSEWRWVLVVLPDAVPSDILHVDTGSIYESIELRPVRFGGVRVEVSEHSRGASEVTVSRKKLLRAITTALRASPDE